MAECRGQQATDFRVGIVDHRTYAVARQHIGSGKPRRPRADDRDTMAGFDDVRHIGTPALLPGGVGDVALDVADADGAESVIQRTGAFAQAILRANPAADLGQRVGLVGQVCCLEQLAFLDQPQPVRNVVVHRALPFAVRIATGQTTSGLACSVWRCRSFA